MAEAHRRVVDHPATEQRPKAPPPEPPPNWGWHPARPAGPRRRHVALFLSFLVVVVLPAGVACWYLFARAADQFVSHAGFSIRSEEAAMLPGFDSSFGMLATGTSPSAGDAEMLQAYLMSPGFTAALDSELDLGSIWSRPRARDPILTLDPDSGAEALHGFWQKMVRVTQLGTNGLVEIEVRAFTPADAQRIAEAMVTHADEIVNRMSKIAEQEITRAALASLAEAETRLSTAREALTRFRNQAQIIDPEADLEARMGVLSSLEEALANTLIERDLLLSETRASDVRIEAAERRIVVIEARITSERNRLGLEGDADAMAARLGRYEALISEREFAEEAWAAARGVHDKALADARRQSRFLAAFQEPSLPDRPVLPERHWLASLITLAALMIWVVLVLMAYSLKDRR